MELELVRFASSQSNLPVDDTHLNHAMFIELLIRGKKQHNLGLDSLDIFSIKYKCKKEV